MENLMYLLAVAVIGCASAVPLDSSSSRIANGVVAAENQFPYAISLQQIPVTGAELPSRGHRCGGALITLRHALTTASCLHENVNGVSVVIAPAQHRVFAGSSLLSNASVADRIRSVSDFSIHPNYTGEPAFVHDIGIITLTLGFSAATVTPLALPRANFNPPDFTPCQVAGWGGNNYSTSFTNELTFADKYIYNQDLCTMLFNSQPYISNVMTTMVCAASYAITPSGCINDNGNALVCDGTLTGVLFVTDSCRGTSFPELYTRVSNYTTWINSISGSPALFKPGVIILAAIFSITHLFLRKH